jgi:IclR family mhp operon transcriptional activator
MAAAPPIQAVVRAIEVLQALNRQPVSTIDVLHRQTGVPKPSLVRLLQTLAAKGLVRHAPQYGAYYLTSLVGTLSCGYHSEPRIVEAATPVADALTRRIKWPLAVAVFDGDAMVVRYSTIPSSPLSLLHSSINMRLSVVARALGRAYLAFCPPDEQAVILAAVRESRNPEDAVAKRPREVAKLLAEVRRRGYAVRDPKVRPVSNTLAVPLHEGERVIGSLGMTWFASVMPPEKAVRQHLGHLKDAAAEIAARLGALRPAGRP